VPLKAILFWAGGCQIPDAVSVEVRGVVNAGMTLLKKAATLSGPVPTRGAKM
jgi:hypothetical protein